MTEFELIERYFRPLGAPCQAEVILGQGDDCALLQCPPGMQLAVSVDTLVSGIHFLPEISPSHLGWRVLAVSISDLAAMGAKPLAFTLALTLPEINPGWLAHFSQGLAEAARTFGVALIGGDTTRGALCITLQVFGVVAADKALRRQGAQPGDLVCVSGSLGDAGAALAWLSDPFPHDAAQQLLMRYYRPQPRLSLGQVLVGYAHAAIDVSDGLVADLHHILRASRVGADIDCEALPLSASLCQSVTSPQALQLALTAGDDYELCFTIAQDQWPLLQARWRDAAVPLTVIGRIVEEAGCRIWLDGQPLTLPSEGYDHFRTPLTTKP